MSNPLFFDFRKTAQKGLIAGIITLSVSIIGMVELFEKRALIANFLTMGQVLIFAATAILAYQYSQSIPRGKTRDWILSGLTIGIFSTPPAILLIWLAQIVNLRQFFPNVSPALTELLSFHQEPIVGSLALAASFTIVGLIAAGASQIPDKIRRPLLNAIFGTLTIGLFS
ncbi:MAG: hypothetical protein N2C13_03620, partial [Chloroflexota bacterium]